MRYTETKATIPGRTADETYRVLADFGRYADHSDAVRSVTISESGPDQAVSTWEVNFRNGILRWSEEDLFDAGRHRITFRQLDGDIAVFAGSWEVSDGPDGSQVTFAARLDLGIPTLAEVLEPIAIAAVHDNISSILHGLFGDEVHVEHLPAPVPSAT